MGRGAACRRFRQAHPRRDARRRGAGARRTDRHRPGRSRGPAHPRRERPPPRAAGPRDLGRRGAGSRERSEPPGRRGAGSRERSEPPERRGAGSRERSEPPERRGAGGRERSEPPERRGAGSMSAVPPIRADLGLGEGYHSPQVEAAVRLNTNESPVPPPDAWLHAVQRELASVAWHRYPDRSAWALRKALAALHNVAPEQVWCANGSNEVLQTLLLAYGGAGRSVAVWEPTYALHRHIAELTATAVVVGRRGADLMLDRTEVRRVIDAEQPTVTFLCSPNNPTGEVVDPAVVADVLARAPGLVVVDEAYGQFAPWSAADLVSEDLGLVVTRTYSKTWSLAGLRLGYCLAPSSVVTALERAYLPYHTDSFTQLAGRLALDHVEAME